MKKNNKNYLKIYGSLERKQYCRLMNRRYNRGKESYYGQLKKEKTK